MPMDFLLCSKMAEMNGLHSRLKPRMTSTVGSGAIVDGGSIVPPIEADGLAVSFVESDLLRGLLFW